MGEGEVPSPELSHCPAHLPRREPSPLPGPVHVKVGGAGAAGRWAPDALPAAGGPLVVQITGSCFSFLASRALPWSCWATLAIPGPSSSEGLVERFPACRFPPVPAPAQHPWGPRVPAGTGLFRGAPPNVGSRSARHPKGQARGALTAGTKGPAHRAVGAACAGRRVGGAVSPAGPWPRRSLMDSAR